MEYHVGIGAVCGLYWGIAAGGWPALGGDTLVYSNTTGREQIVASPGFIVSDDILMTGADGCLLDRYSFVVSGNADGSGSGAFTVEHALYDDCPHLGGQVIQGTQGRAVLPDEGVHTVSFVSPIDVEVALPATFWIGLKFDRGGAGWVGGSPALVGYTSFTYGEMFFGCWTPLGGAFPFAPWGGFNAEVHVRGGCDETFRSYHAADNRAGAINLKEGVRIADDVELSVDDCRLRGYEVTFRGTGHLDVDLRLVDEGNAGLPGEVVPGTPFSVAGSTNRLQIARKTFEEPFFVPKRLWVTARPDTDLVRAVVVRQPVQVGATDGMYAVLGEPGWERVDFSGSLSGGALEVSFICDGGAPLGACCDMFVTDEDGEAVCRDVAEMNCAFPPRGTSLLPGWRAEESCASMPFDPPCGAAACCGADGVCANLTENGCAVNGVTWSRGMYCDDPEVECEFVCVASEELCTLPHASVGCTDPFCCRAVCSLLHQDFCCAFEWDEACVIATAEVCAIPPSNDECASDDGIGGARLIPVPGSLDTDSVHATENLDDPGFCCHEEQPGATGLGTVWYKFVATETSVRIRTCQSASPATDSLVRVFSVGNAESEGTSCDTLSAIGCNDDTRSGCGFVSDNSELCVHDLVVGEVYYILVAAKTEEARGRYRVDIAAPCNDPPPPTCPCPVGSVRWLNPPPGVVDARRPHPPSEPDSLEGSALFTAEAPREADREACWAVCESPTGAPANQIAAFLSGVGGTTTLALQRPITAGSSMRIAYTDGLGATTNGVFTSHPGNVNANGASDAEDVYWIVAMLSGQVELPFDLASGDIDRSGRITPSDILEEINLLNGADEFQPWDQTTLPGAPISCP